MIIYSKTNNVTYYCPHNIAWCVLYRRPVLIEPIATRLEEIIADVVEGMHILFERTPAEIQSLAVLPDRVYLRVDVDPQIGLHHVVKQIKAVSSRTLREEFPALKTRLPTLWTNKYFASTIDCDDEVESFIRDQPDSQRERERHREDKRWKKQRTVAPPFAPGDLSSEEQQEFYERRMAREKRAGLEPTEE